ncbi:RNA-binding domain-containing protein [Mesorhizobium sp. B2-4-8]|uniref:RNA-binding domain-containing protein n=1 Tax=Mesorhizobium sp. B2-4-8 TaxID=2589941 RepID=UPI00112D409E|nr:RNA-binding domain-containing protein [Mesorhizobium sp. B2-4-8]TPL27336.1 hypothetical protein FJ947_29395 [Mesorhizobium sp. B2-4-8]
MAKIEDIVQLFGQESESLSVEYKSWLELSANKGKAILAKAAIAIGNHGGGTIIFGMREGEDGPIGSHSRPSEIARYTADAVNSAINRYADPQIHCDVLHLNHPETGNEHCFVLVPGGHTVPIMSVRGAEDGQLASQRTYIRKPGPKSEEPFTADEWRGLMNRCLQNGRDELLDSVRNIFFGLQRADGQVDRLKVFTEEAMGRWADLVSHVPPTDVARISRGGYELAFEIEGVTPAASMNELMQQLEKAHEIKHTGWPPFVVLNRQPIAPAAVDGALQAWIGPPGDIGRSGRHVDFWRISKDGLLYQLRALDEDFHSEYQPGTVFSLTTPVWRVGDASLFAARLAEAWGGAKIVMRGRYFGLKGRKLTVIDGWLTPMSYPRVSQSNEVQIGFEATPTEVLNNTEELMRVTLAPLYELFELFTPSMQMIISETGKLKAGRF